MSHPQEQEHGYSHQGAVTSRGGTVADLHQVIEILRGILEGAPGMIAVEDTASRYLAFNSAYHAEFKKVFGVDLKVGSSMVEALAHLPLEQQAATEIFERTLSGEDFTVIHEFGDERLARRFYELHCFPLRDGQGRVIGGAHIARDVTEQRRAEETLRASEENYRRIIDSSTDCIKVLDLEGHLLSINPGGQHLMELDDLRGYLGHVWLDAWQGEDRCQATAALERARAGGVGRFNALGATAKGTPKWWDVTISPILDLYDRPERLLVIARDITDQKKAEAELRRSEIRYRSLINALPAAVYTCDTEGRITLYNEQAATLWGRRPEIGKDYWCGSLRMYETNGKLLPLDLCPMALALRQSEHATQHQEIIIERPDGSRVNVMPFPEPIRDANGRLVGAVNVLMDITSIRQAEEALRASEEFNRRMIASSDDCIKVLDLDLNMLSMNEGGQHLMEIEDIGPYLNTSYLNFWKKDAQPKVVQAMEAARAGAVGRFEGFCPSVKGKPRWWDGRVTPIRGADGQPERLLVIARDITEQKLAQEALQRERTFLRQVIDATPSLIFVKDWEGRFVLANETLAYCYGTTIQDVVDKTDADFNSNLDELEHFRHDDRQVMSTCQEKLIPEEKVTFANGEVHWLSTIKVPLINEDGTCGKVLGVASDITARKRAEIKLAEQAEALREANAQLAEADRRKNEFLAMLAHELRNPLAPIRNAMQVLRMVDLKEPIQQRQGDIIDRQIGHMARLLNDLLDVSRITRGKIELSRKPLALSDVLSHALETARPLIESRHHTLTVTPPPANLRVLADLDRLAQVVGNLLTNAAKYTEEGGQIWLEMANSDGQAVIRVRDTGVGIAPELLPHIFELFTQADHSLARSQGGLGIGLTMVHSLVEMHGGSVEAHSAGLGQGSEFVIRLPALADMGLPEATWPEPPRTAMEEIPPRRVLVVDDITDTAQSLSELLELWGHRVHVAYDGAGALEAARAFNPEVVLLDIGLPDMDGFEVARRLRQEPGGDKLVIVALTGYGQRSDQQQSSAAGFNHHLVKPVDLEILKTLLMMVR